MDFLFVTKHALERQIIHRGSQSYTACIFVIGPQDDVWPHFTPNIIARTDPDGCVSEESIIHPFTMEVSSCVDEYFNSKD